MKFTTHTSFKSAFGAFAANKTHDSDKLGIDTATIQRWNDAGWITIHYDVQEDEGGNVVVLRPNNGKHAAKVRM